MSTVRTNNILDASGGNTATINSMTPTADSLQGQRNRIINGDMRIDQRGSASTSITTNGAYSVDRWITFKDNDGSYTGGQSTVAPTGYTNSYLFTVTGTDSSIAAGQYAAFVQRIEGFNVADLGFGTASAKTVTISFWVRSSVTGTFSGAIGNGGSTRSYSFDYTISAANTWEQKTVTIAGDTSGTWTTNNTTGLYLSFGLAVGSDWSLATGSWATRSGGFFALGSTNQTNLMATNGATWYITGVQLEVGSTATPFERRPYGTELMLCQRYYQTIYNLMACAAGTTQIQSSCQFPVPMRAAPTIGQGGSGTGLKFTDGTSDFNPTSFSFTNQNTTSQGFFGLFPNYSSLTSRSALSLASDGGRWVTLSIEL